MTHALRSAVLVAAAIALAAACSSAKTTDVGAESDTTTSAATSGTAGSGTVVNVWTAPGSVDPTALPMGDHQVTTTTPAVGIVFRCGSGGGVGGAAVDGPWIHGSTYDRTAKVHVQGDVAWPGANFRVTVADGTRTIVTDDLPVETHTGTFPITASDPAHAYDQNPNKISESATTVELPVEPTAAASPTCLSPGAIGVLANGVFLFDALDGEQRDAVAHETQDLCDGHPAPGDQYHYHDIPSCLANAATGSSTVVGWAYDGYPIVVERDAAGNLPTDADLDECHGRTGPVLVDGQVVTTYHYSATLEFPYTLGCFHGTSAVSSGGPSRGGPG